MNYKRLFLIMNKTTLLVGQSSESPLCILDVLGETQSFDSWRTVDNLIYWVFRHVSKSLDTQYFVIQYSLYWTIRRIRFMDIGGNAQYSVFGDFITLLCSLPSIWRPKTDYTGKPSIWELDYFATRSTISTNHGNAEYNRDLQWFAGVVPPPQIHVELKTKH